MTLDEATQKEKAEIYELVFKYFKEDHTATEQWFNYDNLNLGGISPNKMLLLGRSVKLKAFVKQAMKNGYNE